jgi:transcriptional regulator with XRE-family HTH domain
MAANLGDRIRGLRLEKHWTQGDLAEKVGVTREAVSYWELNRRTPAIGTLEKIAQVLGVPVADLLERPVAPLGEPPEDPPSWESVLASVRERQRTVEAKVTEIVEASVHGEVDPYQVKWALDEAQDCEVTLMLALPGSQRQGQKITINNLFAVSPDQWEEVRNASSFYHDDVVKRLVDAGLVEIRERAGQKPEAVPAGIGAS